MKGSRYEGKGFECRARVNGEQSYCKRCETIKRIVFYMREQKKDPPGWPGDLVTAAHRQMLWWEKQGKV